MPEQMRTTCHGAVLEVTRITLENISAKCFFCSQDYAEVTGGMRTTFLYPEELLIASVKCQREGCKGILVLNGASQQAYVSCYQCGEPHLRVESANFRWSYVEFSTAKPQ